MSNALHILRSTAGSLKKRSSSNSQNVCLDAVKAKAYCKGSSCGSQWLRTRFVGSTKGIALLQSDDQGVSHMARCRPYILVDGNINVCNIKRYQMTICTLFQPIIFQNRSFSIRYDPVRRELSTQDYLQYKTRLQPTRS